MKIAKLKNGSPVIKSILITLLLIVSCREESIFRFTKGIEPVFYSVEEDSIRDKSTGEILQDSKSCKSCHKKVFENWYNSRHRVAFTNELYKESHEREPKEWCVNCHAPLLDRNVNRLSLENRILKEEGISCNVCHVRNKKILVSKIPKSQADNRELTHDYQVELKIGKSEFCANCHQFNFPTLKSARSEGHFEYSNLPMQNTFTEFKESYLSKYGECQACHLAANSNETHSFFGGHDREKLNSSLFLEIERISKNTILVTVITNGIPHSFPTGDLFRTLRIILKNSKTGNTVGELSLKKDYSDVKTSEDKNTPSMILLADNRIISPNISHTSSASFQMHLEENVNEIEAELFMDYLHGLNRLTTDLPENLTRLKIKKVYFKLKKTDASG